ncbi:MAG: RidA family protein [Phycisphaerales bacterium]
MPTLHTRLERAGLTLPPPPAALASYVPAVSVSAGRLVFVSGQTPMRDGAPIVTGLVGRDVDLQTAQSCARQCALQGLSALQQEIGDIERLRRVVKLDGFVACAADFTQHPQVINGASDLLEELLGDDGRHARAAVGVSSLPLGVPVEIAFTFLVD